MIVIVRYFTGYFYKLNFKIKIIPESVNVLFVYFMKSGVFCFPGSYIHYVAFWECFRLVFRCSYLQFYVQADWVEEMLS